MNIRVLNGDDEAIYAIDGVYSYQEMSYDEFIDEVYPEFIEELEAAFPETELYYFNP